MYRHLSGSLYVPPGPKDFSSGDKIKCDVDVELLTLASVAGEDADDQVLMVDPCGNIHVQYVLSSS